MNDVRTLWRLPACFTGAPTRSLVGRLQQHAPKTQTTSTKTTKNSHYGRGGLHFGTSMNSRCQLPSYTVTRTHSTAPSAPTATVHLCAELLSPLSCA